MVIVHHIHSCALAQTGTELIVFEGHTSSVNCIQTIAERVETKQVLDKLGALGVEFAQGYYIARPTSVSTFEPWGSNRFSALRA